MILDGNQFTILSVRVTKLRKEETETENPVVKKIIETRITHIKGIVSRHLTCDFSETNVNTFMNI